MLGKKLIKAAAGAAAGGENLYVEDVFSTYLYTGTGAAQTISNGIALGDSSESIYFNGANDTYIEPPATLLSSASSFTFELGAIFTSAIYYIYLNLRRKFGIIRYRNQIDQFFNHSGIP
jgi:hypothetical protein